MDSRNISVSEKIQLLVQALDGSEKTNEALSKCQDPEAMIQVLITASNKMGLSLSREDLISTPPIRDWIWWKNKQALLTLGNGTPRHQQDRFTSKTNFLSRFF